MSVFCALSATAALAQPEFSKAGLKFTGTSGPSVLGGVLSCKKDTIKGEILTKTTVNAVVLFEECARPCPSEVGLEISKGELGSVAHAEAASEVGLLIKTGWTFSCGTTEYHFTGSVAGEVTPLSLALEHEFKFLVAGGAQDIKAITVGSGLVKPEMKINGFGPVTFESIELETFSEPVSIS
jgi:hypothetical protein